MKGSICLSVFLVALISFKGQSARSETPDIEKVLLSEAETENTPSLCSDGIDNDQDGYTDCDDQDCNIFAVCVKSPDSLSKETIAIDSEQEQAVDNSTVKTSVPFFQPERGRQCSDGSDNNGDGLIDCEETYCKRSRFCRIEMYEFRDDHLRPPGLFVNFGFGLALPNYRTPRATTDSVYGSDIPFDPDLGGMLDLQIGFFPIRWIGVGINFKTAFTYSSNEYVYTEGDDDDYKYWGYKTWLNVGGFVRFQWPFERIVPYVNMHLGGSVARNHWNIYDGSDSWSDIWDLESDEDKQFSGPKRHFTFAFEPGFDIFFVKRIAGVGIKAWLPVTANRHPESDNVGLMLSFIFTPTWRGAPVLKEKYQTHNKH